MLFWFTLVCRLVHIHVNKSLYNPRQSNISTCPLQNHYYTFQNLTCPYLWVEIWRINLHLIYLVVLFLLMLHVLLFVQTILLLLQWLLTSMVIGIVVITKSLLEICITCAKIKLTFEVVGR